MPEPTNVHRPRQEETLVRLSEDGQTVLLPVQEYQTIRELLSDAHTLLRELRKGADP